MTIMSDLQMDYRNGTYLDDNTVAPANLLLRLPLSYWQKT